MGCWNETCLISNLPIKCSEPVIGVICKSSKLTYISNSTYHNTLAKPIYLPFKGKYNDYGIVEYITDDLSKLINDFNKKYNHNFNNSEELLNYVRNNDEGFFLCMIKEPIFNLLVNEIGSRQPYGLNITMKQAYLSKVKKYYKLNKKVKILNRVNNNSKEFSLNLFKLMNKVENMFDRSEYKYIIKDLDLSKNENIDKFIELLLFDLSINLLRKNYGMTSGCGSQSRESNLHYKVANYIIQYEKDIIDKYNEEYIDDDDNENLTKETLFFW